MRFALLTALVVAVTALTSCGDAASPSAPDGRTRSDAGQAIGARVQARRSGPAAHLLAADKMPTAGADWTDVATTDNDVQVLGPCHLASLVDIGAMTSVRRTWSAGSSSPKAIQVVARFADNKSAWRAHQVLDSWQADCAANTDGTVGERRTVAVSTGVAEAYRVAQGSAVTDLGIVRKGEYVSVVALLGPADALTADSALARAALKRIAATF